MRVCGGGRRWGAGVWCRDGVVTALTGVAGEWRDGFSGVLRASLLLQGDAGGQRRGACGLECAGEVRQGLPCVLPWDRGRLQRRPRRDPGGRAQERPSSVLMRRSSRATPTGDHRASSRLKRSIRCCQQPVPDFSIYMVATITRGADRVSASRGELRLTAVDQPESQSDPQGREPCELSLARLPALRVRLRLTPL